MQGDLDLDTFTVYLASEFLYPPLAFDITRIKRDMMKESSVETAILSCDKFWEITRSEMDTVPFFLKKKDGSLRILFASRKHKEHLPMDCSIAISPFFTDYDNLQILPFCEEFKTSDSLKNCCIIENIVLAAAITIQIVFIIFIVLDGRG